MTATLVREPATSPPTGFSRLMRAEWTKIRSVRSTVWSLVLLVAVTWGSTALFVGLGAANWDHTDRADQAKILADPTGMILGSGSLLGQLTMCVLGALVITTEYSSGTIVGSLLAVPQRRSMLAAKAVVFGLLTLLVGVMVSFGSFFIGEALFAHIAPVSLGDPGVFRAVVGGGLYLAMVGLFAMAIGAVVRHTAAAIAGVIGFVLVLAPMAQMLPGSLGKHVHAYLPTEAGRTIAQVVPAPGDLLTPWQGFGVFTLWTAVLLALATVLIERRDA
ncbi:ABC transporter permease subunit [Nocardia stercoris]|uniref:ABC transporter permease n=1 Tax=Nocardia stercoris TaxID=2483361 RepID=A0A3M2L5Z3_9NOCA|nr:ABC transporter permease subunit [Nocardia stercoris]RMI32764.1 ABC transporter permease [Nocardia stercoris]